jgi:dolichyl-phosphate beta-glucosyltransferase
MYGFHFFVSIAGVRGIQDTQCGFKLLTKKTAAKIFNNLHIERWAFDVEMVYLAQTLHIPLAEVPVNWQEIDGSKLSPFAASIQMARDILRIRANYFLGSWRVRF